MSECNTDDQSIPEGWAEETDENGESAWVRKMPSLHFPHHAHTYPLVRPVCRIVFFLAGSVLIRV